MSGKETVEFAREAALVQLQLQLESLMSIAKNCRDTVHQLRGMMPPAASPAAKPSPGWRGLLTDRVLAVMPTAARPKLTAVLMPNGSVAVTMPWSPKADWDEVNEAVEAVGGKWVSAGKASRWEVPVPAGGEVGV